MRERERERERELLSPSKESKIRKPRTIPPPKVSLLHDYDEIKEKTKAGKLEIRKKISIYLRRSPMSTRFCWMRLVATATKKT